MRLVLERNNFTNLKPSDVQLLSKCTSCHVGKIKKKRKRKHSRRRDSKLHPKYGHTVVADSSGRQTLQTRSGKRYVNVNVDESTRWSHTALLRTLKHTFDKVTKPLLTRLQGRTKIYRTDPDTEFNNTDTDRLLSELGIKREVACAEEHHQIGLAERVLGVLFDIS